MSLISTSARAQNATHGPNPSRKSASQSGPLHVRLTPPTPDSRKALLRPTHVFFKSIRALGWTLLFAVCRSHGNPAPVTLSGQSSSHIEARQLPAPTPSTPHATPDRALPVRPTVPAPSQVPSKSPSAWLPQPSSDSYRLLPNDLLQIRVFQENELETSVRVGKNGTISFPLIGSVSLGGRTLPEASAVLEQALREYLVRPQISLRILEYSKRKFTVLGQVNRPGTYDFPDESPLSLLEGLGMAGGYTRLANPSRITVRRSNSLGESVFRLDAKRMAKEVGAPRFELKPGDTVLVEESLF